MDQVCNIGEITAKLYRDTCPDINGRPLHELYIVGTNFTQLQIKMSNGQSDITSCEVLEDTLRKQGINYEADMVRDVVSTSKQILLQVAMEQAKPIFKMQKVLSQTPQNQGAAVLDKFSKKAKTTTSKSIRIREASGESQNVFNSLSDKYEISDQACSRLEELHLCGSDSEGEAHGLAQGQQDSRQIPNRYGKEDD